MRRHNTKQPKGADNSAKILPAIQAGAMMANQAVIIYIRKIFIKHNAEGKYYAFSLGGFEGNN
ncbi:hypothetical protein Psyaliredsea_31450 [Psychrobacter alimentarius]